MENCRKKKAKKSLEGCLEPKSPLEFNVLGEDEMALGKSDVDKINPKDDAQEERLKIFRDHTNIEGSVFLSNKGKGW